MQLKQQRSHRANTKTSMVTLFTHLVPQYTHSAASGLEPVRCLPRWGSCQETYRDEECSWCFFGDTCFYRMTNQQSLWSRQIQETSCHISHILRSQELSLLLPELLGFLLSSVLPTFPPSLCVILYVSVPHPTTKPLYNVPQAASPTLT